jgi:extracellular elastinolytic metalloproteinase
MQHSIRVGMADVLTPEEYINSTQAQGQLSTAALDQASPEMVATDLVKVTIPGATFRLVDDHYVGSNGVAHYYFKQTANDLDIDNADFNVNIDRDGTVFSFGNSFYKGNGPSALSKRDTIEPVMALKAVVNNLQLPLNVDKATAESNGDGFAFKQTVGAVSEPKARLVYVQTANYNLALAWRVETDVDTNWLLTYIDATDGKTIHHVVDYAADVTYEV